MQVYMAENERGTLAAPWWCGRESHVRGASGGALERKWFHVPREPAFRCLTLAGAREDQLESATIRPRYDGNRCSVVVGREVPLAVRAYLG